MSRVDITDYIAGDSRRFDVEMQDEEGQPLNITGATVRWAIGTLGATRTALLTKTVGQGIVVTNAVAGLISITLGADEFVQAGKFWHELEVVLPSGGSYTMARGEFRSSPAILLTPPAGP